MIAARVTGLPLVPIMAAIVVLMTDVKGDYLSIGSGPLPYWNRAFNSENDFACQSLTEQFQEGRC